LTGEAVWFALPGRAEEFELPHSAPLADLRDAMLAGGTLTVCTQCAARRGLTPDDLLPGVRIAGSASFVDEALREGAQALVY
jgi:predicted peroxiredoxin